MAKSLVVYFSVYGSTRKLAEEIASQTGSDISMINPITRYDSDKSHYQILTKFAEIEKNEEHRPEIEKIDIKDYDEIYLGYPIWWYTMPMCVYTFLEQNDFNGKKIYPFCTHEGSKDCGTYDTIKSIIPGAIVYDGIDIFGSKMVFDHHDEIKEWLDKLGQ